MAIDTQSNENNEAITTSEDSPARYFRHFKGGEYKLITIAIDCDDPSHELVVYQAMYGDGQVWVRSREEFFSEVERDGYKGPRFTEITKEEVGTLSD